MSTGVEALIAEAMRVLGADAARAEALCRAALQADPANGDAKLLLSEALRRRGDLAGARLLAAAEVQARPNWFGAHRQLGIILTDLREPLAAALALRTAANLNPDHPTIWRDLGDQLGLAGDTAGAQEAYARYAAAPPTEPRLKQATLLLQEGGIAEAEAQLAAVLAQKPSDIVALRLSAEVQARNGHAGEAEATLHRCLEIAPGFGLARHSLGQLLMGLGRGQEALELVHILLRQDPTNLGSRRLHAAILNSLSEYDAAVDVYEKLLIDAPRHAGTWMSLGHVLKTLGRTEEAVVAYRKSIDIEPSLGVSYWSLANLKTVRFTAAEMAQMQAQLAGDALNLNDRINMLYALGKAYEDAERTADAFARYAEGAARYRATLDYDPARVRELVDRSKALYTPAFFAERAGGGCGARDPIFIVGLPRAGSTLIEQILASHSAVEGTLELGDLNAIAQGLTVGDGLYLDAAADLDPAARAALGETYLRTTRVYRKLGRPLFINKMPNDFRHIGLIQLILPNAKIIDARRHPLACGWSCFKQHFAMGQHYTYDLDEIGQYYRDYVRLMAHYDAVLPGRVHRVIHEELVTDPEPHIRALLEYCDLPFEEACLKPHETERAVRTASSEQVRQPISAKGLESWRAYESYLTPLKAALGPVLDAYPGVPNV